jgi:TonB-dependent starch-binding outer membrane protein SusC
MKKRLTAVIFTLFCIGNIVAQNISGVVYDSKKEPLTGVSVMIKGTTQGTATDLDGKFTISNLADASKATLVFNFIGYKTVEKAIGSNTSFIITMEEDAKSLEEVVVIGYGTVKKKDLTTAVSSVRGDAVANRPLVSAAQALQGMAAGVQVTENSGKPGGGITVRVRGTTSINANNEPLYVIDGIPTSDTKNLSVADIESMQVLKDASSAAIYGSRAANGVVLITTKQGKAGTSKVSVSTYYGLAELPKKLDVLNSTQYIALMEEMGYDVSSLSNSINTDWQDEVYRTATTYNTQVAFSGGTEKSHYYVSLGMLNQQGIIDPTAFKRHNIKVNLDQEVKKWLKIGTNIAWSKLKSNDVTDNANVAKGGVVLGALTTPPTLTIYNADGSFTANPYQAGWENPVAAMKGSTNESNSNQFLGNIYAEITFAKDLKFKSSLSLENNDYAYNSFTDPYLTSNGRSYSGIGIAQTKKDITWLIENTLNYRFKIGKKQSLDLLGGVTQQKYDYNETYQQKSGYSSAAITTLDGASTTISNTTDAAQWSMVSFIGRAAYDYAGKYLLTASIRRDGSSRFGPNNRWGTFPSVSVGWRISDENFMAKTKSFLDDMKIRAGYGLVGNQPSDYYAYDAKETAGGAYPFPEGAISSISISTSGNDNLKWETTSQLNGGIDASMFNSRVNLSLDSYYKKTKDLIIEKTVSAQTGFTSQYANIGNVRNMGIEISLNTRNLIGKFKWNTDLYFGLNRNKVINLNGATYYTGYIYERDNASIVKEGQPIGAFYGYISEGVDPSTGMLTYKTDEDGNNLQTIIGSAQPKFTYGLTNSFSYKNVDLSIFLQGVQGNDVLNATRIETEGMENYKNQSTAVLRRWTQAGDVTDIPAAVAGSTDNSQVSTRFIEDGSFLRVKAVTLSYNLQNSFIKKANIGSVKLYVTGQNLLTFTHYSGYDPELSLGGTSSDAQTANAALGIDYGTFPQPRTIIFGMNIEF